MLTFFFFKLAKYFFKTSFKYYLVSQDQPEANIGEDD